MGRIRFCAYQYADQPLDELIRRWKMAEELGFDVLWNCDAINDPDFPRAPFFEATSILTAMAMHTSTIRVGTLMNSLIFRNPAVVAKAAMTIDHISGGRLEFGFGGGVLEADHRNSGVPWWSGRERVARFREAIHIVDLMFRNEVTTWSGEHYAVDSVELIPGPVQKPRPPFSIPAHGPKMLRIAAEYADSWSSWGGYEIETEQHMFAVTRERARLFDELCSQFGRDPQTVWHSLVVFPPLTPWESADYFRDMVGRYGEIGIDEFVLYWPRKCARRHTRTRSSRRSRGRSCRRFASSGRAISEPRLWIDGRRSLSGARGIRARSRTMPEGEGLGHQFVPGREGPRFGDQLLSALLGAHG